MKSININRILLIAVFAVISVVLYNAVSTWVDVHYPVIEYSVSQVQADLSLSRNLHYKGYGFVLSFLVFTIPFILIGYNKYQRDLVSL